LPDWTREAQQAGCTVGLTTNGDLLADASEWLLRGDVDQVVVSLAGDVASHAALRDGSCVDAILEASGVLNQRAKKQHLRLRVQGSYLLTRENAADLPIVVQKVARSGLDGMYVVHLDCRTSEYQCGQSAFEGEDLCEGIAPYLEEAERKAHKLGLDYRGPARQAEELLACALDPAQFVFIAWDGRVSPCVNLLLPGVESIPRWTKGGPIRVAPVWFGKLTEMNLGDLLNATSYQRFVAPYRARREAERQFLNLFLNGFWGVRHQLDAADKRRSSVFKQNPFPAGCRACPKASGW
jgi:hypothetical protein